MHHRDAWLPCTTATHHRPCTTATHHRPCTTATHRPMHHRNTPSLSTTSALPPPALTTSTSDLVSFGRPRRRKPTRSGAGSAEARKRGSAEARKRGAKAADYVEIGRLVRRNLQDRRVERAAPNEAADHVDFGRLGRRKSTSSARKEDGTERGHRSCRLRAPRAAEVHKIGAEGRRHRTRPQIMSTSGASGGGSPQDRRGRKTAPNEAANHVDFGRLGRRKLTRSTRGEVRPGEVQPGEVRPGGAG
ncbi:hypothetical protein CLV67_12175 [Actinoplanes italicus]|uniref:Uncharacterized protein n=1 Tax=Actinoplanes italicus TaxID=113567 RepID=A0A2T0JZX5_9ACTN|nr:hypothetical protein CLV67_12175 [Actinoplanes italicus]